jgi:hypothetical protein
MNMWRKPDNLLLLVFFRLVSLARVRVNNGHPVHSLRVGTEEGILKAFKCSQFSNGCLRPETDFGELRALIVASPRKNTDRFRHLHRMNREKVTERQNP